MWGDGCVWVTGVCVSDGCVCWVTGVCGVTGVCVGDGCVGDACVWG